MKLNAISPRFVEFIPKTLEDGVLYISKEYETASHRCCCGCGSKIVISLRPTDHRLIEDGTTSVSIQPSIGNWDFPCQSHYWIDQNRVVWAGPMTKEQIRSDFLFDEAQRQTHFADLARNRKWWIRLWNWIVGLFKGVLKR